MANRVGRVSLEESAQTFFYTFFSCFPALIWVRRSLLSSTGFGATGSAWNEKRRKIMEQMERTLKKSQPSVLKKCHYYSRIMDMPYYYWVGCFFFWFGGILGSASRAEIPVSLSNHVGFTPRLFYSSTHHSPDCFIHLKTGWAQDAWLQWSYENWFYHLDIRSWLGRVLINCYFNMPIL